MALFIYYCTLSLLAALLSLAIANPTTCSNELEIPIPDLVLGNLASYTKHPLYAKFEYWAARSPHSAFLRGKTNVTIEHPNLDGIVCLTYHEDCLLAS
jgi:hypothetical protein